MDSKNKLPILNCCTIQRTTDTVSQPVAESAALQKVSADAGKDGMIVLTGGMFLMGSDNVEGFPQDGEGPMHSVTLAPFYIDACTVTNAGFRNFVQDTGYRTDAERYGWSFVFHHFVQPAFRSKNDSVVRDAPWWWKVNGAYWAAPEGEGSDVENRLDHPVVHISWQDAVAYSAWAGKRLPTEAEWEHAARGGLVQKRYPWGDTLLVNGEHQCNIWQGPFPSLNRASDGFAGTAPVQAFKPNAYGLFNVSGNVWEWCADWFSPHYYRNGSHDNPKGPAKGSAKVIRGGSYLCHKSYCNRYRVAARSSNTPDSSTGHMGFRCASNV